MHLVTADPVGLNQIVLAHAGPDCGLFIAHADGSISRYDEDYNLVSIWLNPAKRVSCMIVLDNGLFVGFDDCIARVYSLSTGLVIDENKLPFVFTGVAVFERTLIGWSKFHLDICLLHRFNFDHFQSLCAESFVVNVFSVSGEISVVTSTGVWWLRETKDCWTLKKIYGPSSDEISAACCFRKSWLLAQDGVWKLMSYDGSSGSLTEDMAGNTPVNTVVTAVSSTSAAVLMQCTQGKYAVIQHNNVQVLNSPEGLEHDSLNEILIANSAKLAKSDLRIYEAVTSSNGELQWQSRELPLGFTRQTYLAGQDNPSVSAIFESKDSGLRYIGKDTGHINDILVFPTPVIRIDKDRAHCRDFAVSLPLEDINVTHPISPQLHDRRVTTKIKHYVDGTSWIGISDLDSVYVTCADPEKRSMVTLVLLLLNKVNSLEELIEEARLDHFSITDLEELVILATERKDQPLLKTSAEFLEKLWSSERIGNLLKVGGPYSLRILASAAPFVGLEKRQIYRILESLMLSEDLQSCDAVLWFFENCDTMLENLQLPFASLSPISERRLLKFAQTIAFRTGGIDWSLQNVSDLFAEPETSASLRLNAPRSMALRFLNATLNLAQPFELIYSETQLVRLVEILVASGQRNSKETKSLLMRLIESHYIQFHKERQLILLPTYHSKTQAGYVYEITNGNKASRISLQWPSTPLEISVESLVLGFGGDGKRVNGMFGKTKYAWPLQRSFTAIFSLKKNLIEPVML